MFFFPEFLQLKKCPKTPYHGVTLKMEMLMRLFKVISNHGVSLDNLKSKKILPQASSHQNDFII